MIDNYKKEKEKKGINKIDQKNNIEIQDNNTNSNTNKKNNLVLKTFVVKMGGFPKHLTPNSSNVFVLLFLHFILFLLHIFICLLVSCFLFVCLCLFVVVSRF